MEIENMKIYTAYIYDILQRIISLRRKEIYNKKIVSNTIC